MSIADKILALQTDSAAIASAIAAKGVTVPAGSGYDDYATLIGQISGGGGGGPYDSRIEYLESTGTQFICTGLGVGTNFKSEIKAELTQNSGGYDTLLGSYSSNAYSVMLGFQPGGAPYAQLGAGTSYVTSSASSQGLHIYTTTLLNNTQTIDVDGLTASSAKNGNVSPLPLALFGRTRFDSLIGNLAAAKIYYAKIWSGGTLVRDYIPVRVGQVGHLYDNVTGSLFGNIGTGVFTLGPDI